MTAVLDLPFVSAIFFILAGTLLGHLLWYRDRSGDNEKMDGLENRYFKARGSARQRKREFVKLQKDNETFETELITLREKYEKLKLQNEDHQSVALQAGDELSRLRGERDVADERYATEHKRCETVIAQLQEALKLKTASERDLQGQNASFAQLQASHQELETEIENLRSQLAHNDSSSTNHQSTIVSLKQQIGEQAQTVVQSEQARSNAEAENERMRAELTAYADLAHDRSQAESEIERLRAEIVAYADLDQDRTRAESEIELLRAELNSYTDAANSGQQIITTLHTQVAEHEQTIKRFEQTQIALETEIEQLTATLDAQAATSDQSAAEHQQNLNAVRNELSAARKANAAIEQSLKETQTDLVARCEDLDTLRQERDSLLTQIAATDVRLSELNIELENVASTKSERDELASDLQSAASSLAEQREQLEATEQELEQLRLKHVAAQEQVRFAAEQLADLKHEKESLTEGLADRDEFIASLRSQLEELLPLKAELAEIAVVLGEQKTSNQKRVEQIASQKSAIADLEANIAKLDAELKHSHDQLTAGNASNEDFAKQLQEKSVQHEQSLVEIAKLNQTLDAQRSNITRLAAQVKPAEELRTQNTALEARINDLLPHLKRVSAEHEDSLESNAKALDRIRDLENQLHENAAKMRDLRRERASIAGLDNRDDGNQIRRAA